MVFFLAEGIDAFPDISTLLVLTVYREKALSKVSIRWVVLWHRNKKVFDLNEVGF